MTHATCMDVTLLLPSQVLYHGQATRLRADGQAGSFGVLPNHADFVTALVPSVLVLLDEDGTERFFGIDEGLLVKRDQQVSVVVRRGVLGDDLETLHQKVRDSFIDAEDDERVARSALSRLEADMVRRLGQLKRMQP